MRFARRVQKVQSSAIRDLLRHGSDPHVISFAGGFPDPTLFPAAQLNAIYTELLTKHSLRALQYTVTEGIPELRAQVAAHMRADNTPCTADDVLILHGAQQGLDLAAKMMLEPGDTVVVEDPTFLGATIAFNVFEPRYTTVRMDAEGMDTDHLEAVLQANPRKPNSSTPSPTSTTPPASPSPSPAANASSSSPTSTTSSSSKTHPTAPSASKAPRYPPSRASTPRAASSFWAASPRSSPPACASAGPLRALKS